MNSRLIASSESNGVLREWLCTQSLNSRTHSSGDISGATGIGLCASKRSPINLSSGTPLDCASARNACSTSGGRFSVTVIQHLLFPGYSSPEQRNWSRHKPMVLNASVVYFAGECLLCVLFLEDIAGTAANS